MSSNADTNSVDEQAVEDAIETYTDTVETEVHEAVTAVLGVVNTAAEAGDQTWDVAEEIGPIVRQLSMGERVVAAEAAIDLLDDDTRTEAEQALDAIQQVMDDTETAIAEVVDVGDLLADGAAAIEAGVLSLDIPLDHLNSIGDYLSDVFDH